MPKKPLSMYMLYYSEKREEILAEQPKLSMPEVAKICSEQYQKLSDKKKARYVEFVVSSYQFETTSLNHIKLKMMIAND